MLPRPPAVLVVGLAGLLAAPLLTACSGSGGLDESYSVEDALAELPAIPSDEAFAFVQTADLEAATELGDLDPDDDDWLRGLLTDPVYIPLPGTLQTRSVAELEDSVGFALEDVGSYAALRRTEGSSYVEVYRLAEGDPPDDSDDVDGLARASDGDRIALASDEDRLADWEERDDTLADDEDLGPLAEALDDRDVYAAILSTVVRDDDPTVRAYGVGQAVEDGEAVEYAVYALGEDEDADEVAEEIEAGWGDTGAAEDGRLEVEEVDTEGDRVVVVTIRPDQAGETTRAVIAADFPVPE